MTKIRVAFLFPEKLLETLDKAVEACKYESRTAFVLESVRDKLREEAQS